MENLSFHLEGIVREKDSQQDFEGPLSLILMLLQKNRIEIRDLKISDILDQYLDYLDRMQHMDLEVASEFVQMASHLLYLKTRTLLAAEEEARRRGCHSVHVDTMSWQAPEFYKKHGYKIISELEDIPLGNKKFHLVKDL